MTELPIGYIMQDGRQGTMHLMSDVPVWCQDDAPEGWDWFEMGKPLDVEQYPELAEVFSPFDGAVPDLRGRVEGQEPESQFLMIKHSDLEEV